VRLPAKGALPPMGSRTVVPASEEKSPLRQGVGATVGLRLALVMLARASSRLEKKKVLLRPS